MDTVKARHNLVTVSSQAFYCAGRNAANFYSVLKKVSENCSQSPLLYEMMSDSQTIQSPCKRTHTLFCYHEHAHTRIQDLCQTDLHCDSFCQHLSLVLIVLNATVSMERHEKLGLDADLHDVHAKLKHV